MNHPVISAGGEVAHHVEIGEAQPAVIITDAHVPLEDARERLRAFLRTEGLTR